MKPDWKDAPGWANWFARDENGECWWYEFKPEKKEIYFRNTKGRHDIASIGSDGWQDSLEQRP